MFNLTSLTRNVVQLRDLNDYSGTGGSKAGQYNLDKVSRPLVDCNQLLLVGVIIRSGIC